MNKNKKALTVVSAAAALALGGGGLAFAAGGTSPAAEPAPTSTVTTDDGHPEDSETEDGDGRIEEPETVVTGPDADKAGKAAVDAAGGGTAGQVEQEGTEGYDVSVTRPDGSAVEVEVSPDFVAGEVETDEAAEDEAEDEEDEEEG